jgi:catechol 2,3-dioxygenase-like lactoylglutathione lyase family enzyme
MIQPEALRKDAPLFWAPGKGADIWNMFLLECGAKPNERMAMPEQRVIPALRITDYERSKRFYVDSLGFRVEWEHRFQPHFPVFVSIVRDGMRLYLSEHTGDCQVGGLVHFLIPDVDAWYGEFKDRGIEASEPPNSDLGFRNMTVTDPDGNQLRFMAPTTEAGAADEKGKCSTAESGGGGVRKEAPAGDSQL